MRSSWKAVVLFKLFLLGTSTDQCTFWTTFDMTFFSRCLGIFLGRTRGHWYYVCDLHDFVEESTEVIFLWKKTEATVQNHAWWCGMQYVQNHEIMKFPTCDLCKFNVKTTRNHKNWYNPWTFSWTDRLSLISPWSVDKELTDYLYKNSLMKYIEARSGSRVDFTPSIDPVVAVISLSYFSCLSFAV